MRSLNTPEEKFLLTGPQGSIGSLLLSSFPTKQLDQWVVIDLHKPKHLPKGVRFYKIDLTEAGVDARLAQILKKEKIKTVVHSSIFWNPSRRRERAHEVEVIGTLHLLNACREAHVRKLLVVSSTIVYGAKPTNPNFLTESAQLYAGYSNRYLRDKVELEEEVREFRQKNPKICVTVLRPCMVVGPKVQNFITGIISQPVIPTILGYDPLIQFLHEDDLLKALRRTLASDHPGEFNIVGSGVLPLSYAIQVAGKVNLPIIYSLSKPVLHLLWNLNVVEFPPHIIDYLRYLWVADGKKAEREFDFKPQYSSKKALESFCGNSRLKKLNLDQAVA